MKTRTLSKIAKKRPQEYVYQGSPSNIYQNSKNIENELCFQGTNEKGDFVEKRQNKPSEIRLPGVPYILSTKTPKT